MSRLVPFGQGLRPFFLLAGLDAIFNMAVWLAVYLHPAWWPQNALPAMFWHAHEMFFGFIAAAIAGFLLTAVPGWTGRSSYAGKPLLLLSAIWLAGRIAMFPFAHVPPFAAAVIDLLFFPALVLPLAPPLVRARKVHNLPFVVLLTALFLADLLFQLGVLGAFASGEPAALGVAADVALILIVIVGGRIIPAFTRSGLARRGVQIQLVVHRWIEWLAIVTAVLVLAADAALPDSAISGWIALAAAAAQLARMIQWQGWRAWREPLIWVLHLGYAWLIAGLALKGAWLLFAPPFAAKWMHALTVGAFATMILAVMTRASLGHTGRALAAPQSMAASYLLVTLAAIVRVFGPALCPVSYDTVILIAGVCWLLAFALFTLVYAPILTLPRVDGRPG